MKIFIGCSSSNDIPSIYREDCKILLNQLFKSDNDLVFGACNEGIMGDAYTIALKNNKKITGICTDCYKEDFKSLKCTKEITTNSVSKRTTELINESDILLFLPGGIGTIHELFASIDSKRCNEHRKIIIIYNSHNYFDEIISILEKIYNESFTNISVRETYFITDNKDEILSYIKEQKEKINC